MVPEEQVRRREPDAKRAALLDAAITTFSEKGYGATSMASIAKQAGVAVGTIYRFYPDKLALLSALHDGIEREIITHMRASWAEGGDYADRLHRMVQHLFDYFDAHRVVLSILSMTTDIGGAEGTLPADGIRETIADFLKEGIETSSYTPEEPETLASLVHGTVEGVMRQFLIGRIPKERAVGAVQLYLSRAVVTGKRDQ